MLFYTGTSLSCTSTRTLLSRHSQMLLNSGRIQLPSQCFAPSSLNFLCSAQKWTLKLNLCYQDEVENSASLFRRQPQLRQRKFWLSMYFSGGVPETCHRCLRLLSTPEIYSNDVWLELHHLGIKVGSLRSSSIEFVFHWGHQWGWFSFSRYRVNNPGL